MYADDLAQAATSVAGLRKQIDLLKDYAARWGLTINASKTHIVVFANRRDKKAEEEIQISIGGVQVDVRESFTYLGVSMHCSASFGSFAAPVRKASGREAL